MGRVIYSACKASLLSVLVTKYTGKIPFLLFKYRTATWGGGADVGPEALSCALDHSYYVFFAFGITCNRLFISVWNSNRGTPLNGDD